MIACVMYDISHNKFRNKIYKLCKDYGLVNIQKSIFVGQIENIKLERLYEKIEDCIDPDEDAVYIFPCSKSQITHSVCIGRSFDKKMVLDEEDYLFL